MELIPLDTLIKVYKVYSSDDVLGHSRSSEIKELVDYCDSVQSYLHSVHSTDLEFYKGMIEHDNFLDRMVTFLYIFDNISGGILKHMNFSTIVRNNPDYKLVKELMNRPNREAQEQAYYEVFKKEILAKKREDILNQIL